MPGAIGAMVLPSLLSGTALATTLGSAAPFVLGAAGGGLGNMLGGDDFWKGALGGLAGAGMSSMMPGMTSALGKAGLGDMAPIAANALRGGVTSGVMGGDPLQGALVGGVMGTQPMQQMASAGTNALRSMAGLAPLGDPAQAVAGGAGGMSADDYAMQEAAFKTGGMKPLPGAGGTTQNYLAGFMKPEVLLPAAASFGVGAMQTMAMEDMAERQLDLAREMDTGLGMRKDAANYAMNPDLIPGSPGYQAALNERRRALMRLHSAKGGLQGGALPAQLADSADQLLGDWYGYYSGTANRAGGAAYPNYQNMLRTA